MFIKVFSHYISVYLYLMHLYKVKPLNITRRILYPSLHWEIKSSKKKIFLTFDDGPTPGITEEIIALLKRYNAKATFFLIGDKASRHPELVQLIADSGHAIGNHTYNHLMGWKTNNNIYFDNIKKCNKLLSTTLFRPPYGKIKSSQIKVLQKQYNIIMWSVLSGDFDKNISPQKCFDNVKKHTNDGSIIVFHDSEKAKERMLYSLPKTLETFSSKGYIFDKINLSK